MPKAFEVPRYVLDLPTLFCADLLALHSTTRTGSFFGAQLVDLCGDRKIFEVGQRAPPLAPLKWKLSDDFIRKDIGEHTCCVEQGSIEIFGAARC
jgi:hypothetical protein